MLLQKILTAGFILFGSCVTAQPLFDRIDAVPAENPDTLYYPFNEDGLQLVIINAYDHWRRKGTAYDAMYPRSESWFNDHGPAPKNIYLWRTRSGAVVKQYHTKQGSTLRLRNTDYTNRSNFESIGAYVNDYNEFFGRFKIYGADNQEGLINLKGEIVLPADYRNIRSLRQSAAPVRDRLIVEKDGKLGMMDADLTELLPPVYDGIDYHQVHGTHFKVIKAGKHGAIDQNGKVLVEPQFDEIRPIHDSMYIGLAYQDSAALQKLELRNNNDHWNWGYKVKDCIVFDNHFRIVTELKEYEYIYYWGTRQFIVKKKGEFGVLNHKGEVVIPLEYEQISDLNGYYAAGKNDRYGLINTEGKIVLPLEFTRVEFYGKAVYVVKNELIGVYNDQFRLIAEPQFKYKRWNMGRFILTRPNGSEGFVDHTGKGGCYYQSPEGEIQKL